MSDDPFDEMPVTDMPRSRRNLIAGAGGAVAAIAAHAVAFPAPAAAASIQLGQTNSTNKNTTIRNTAGAKNPKALVGLVTDTTPGVLSAGLQGTNNGNNASGVVGIANRGSSAYGVWGTSTSGLGVRGDSVEGVGVWGDGALGVYGTSAASEQAGVFGRASDEAYFGVAGQGPIGVYGYSDWIEGYGVDGYADEGGFAGIFGSAYDGWAGYFDGDVFIGGDVYYPAALLRVDHPEAPADRWYQRAVVGSFEQVSVISGNATTGADGRARVRVPELFARFHKDFRYQLTPLGRAAGLHVARKLQGDVFVISAEEAGLEVSWQITGVRDDPAARGFKPDAVKRAGERGRFAQPELYGRTRGLAPKRNGGRRPRGAGQDGRPSKVAESE